MCLICMKYRIIILIIIIISVGQKLLSYIANTHTHAHTRACIHVAVQVVDGSLAPNRDAVNAPFRGWSLVHSNEHSRWRHGFHDSLAYKKNLGRIETRTSDRMYCQSIRTV